MESPTWNTFDDVLNLTQAEREHYFRLYNISPPRQEKVRTLLAHEHLLASTVPDGNSEMRPLKCGSFRPTRLLGKGGMGAVWLAERTDGEVRQQVAIKILRSDLESERVRERFLQERQILADLVHPNIARLLDAGHTEDGRPFLALEYVQGEPIDAWAKNQSIPAILKVFCKVCDAVTCAHRSLVIHRDLKPTNIMVNAEGEPKLLDFGIAKLATLNTEQTLTVERFLTPEYASPEQVTGEYTGTATDIYSLGAILYKLLTGVSPHNFHGGTVRALSTVICKDPPAVPSSLNSVLNGDIDFILLKALRKEPEERYDSADQFREDVQRFLESRPIHARANTFLYRGRRFLNRNWLPVVAATAVLASLAVGWISSKAQQREALQQRFIAVQLRALAESQRAEALSQREAAEQARQSASQNEAIARRERAEAQRQKAAAENRFDQVRQLANHLLDLDRDIRPLAGSTKARQSLITTSLAYLEKLEAEAGNDTKFQMELAQAYRQVARIQAEPGSANLAQMDEGLKNLKRDQALLALIMKREPNNNDVKVEMIKSINFQAKVHVGGAAWERGAAELDRAFPLLASLPQGMQRDLKIMRLAADLAYTAQGTYINMNKNEKALQYSRQTIALRRQIFEQSRNPIDEQTLTTNLINYASLSRFAGNLDEAITLAHEARITVEKRYDSSSPDWTNARALRYALYHEALGLGAPDVVNLGKPKEAVELFKRSLDLAKRIQQADPKDVGINVQLAKTNYYLGLLHLESDPQSAVAYFQEGWKASRALPQSNPISHLRFQSMSWLVRAYVKTGQLEEASKVLDQLFKEMTEAKEYPQKAGPYTFAAFALSGKAELQWAQNRREDAIQTLRNMAAEMESTQPNFAAELNLSLCFSDVYQRLAELNHLANNSSESERWAEKHRAIWSAWEKKLPGNPFVVNQAALSRTPLK